MKQHGAPSSLKILNARENNLKGITLEVPHDRLIVVTGLSGSGKSSLAFDTLYAEGQRRYIETFSPYTRQFFDKVKKPEVDLIENVRPALAVRQRVRITNSRSTVGSITDINEYLKVLWGNLAEPVCPACGHDFDVWPVARLLEHLPRLMRTLAIETLWLVAPVDIPTKEGWKALRDRLTLLGFTRVVNPRTGESALIEDVPQAAFKNEKTARVVVDRIRAGQVDPERFRDSLEQTYQLGQGVCECIDPAPALRRPLASVDNTPLQVGHRALARRTFEFRAEPGCGFFDQRIDKPRPSLFSFNHPVGACEECRGFGKILEIDPELCVPNPGLTIAQHAIQCWAGEGATWEHKELLKFCAKRKIPVDVPYFRLGAEQKHLIFTHKDKEFTGVLPWFKYVERKSYKMHVRVFLSRYRNQVDCPTCKGTRLKPSALVYRIEGRTLPDMWSMPIVTLDEWLSGIERRYLERVDYSRAVRDLFASLRTRLGFLIELGVEYLTLDRQARTLSGGETQRVNLAAALGSELVSTTFVLDEPSVGLHPRDTHRLLGAIRGLQARGNTVVMVEHDLDCIGAADHIVELGPTAGEHGGDVVFNGDAEKWTPFKVDRSLTGTPPASDGRWLQILGARLRNLGGFSTKVPLRALTCITGVSGSGKSTLVHEVIMKAYTRFKNGLPVESDENVVLGFDHVSQALVVDQAPLAKSPRANIATYSGIWDIVRDLLAGTDDAQLRGLTRSSFSFNVDAGRCTACSGAGFLREDMQFLSDVYLPCEVCLGKRFQAPVLEVKYEGHSVDDLLNMTVDRAREVLAGHEKVRRLTAILTTLGLGHLTLGHPLSELSGGEAQRLKLVPVIEEGTAKPALLFFDEPTTGLHYHDVRKLMDLFRSLVTAGHTVVCIEHNLPLIAASDWMIDLGPEGGAGGGHLVGEGHPRALLRDETLVRRSHTLRHLEEFEQGKGEKTPRSREAASDGGGRDSLLVVGAREHNLKGIDVEVPLGKMVAVTGVSGSGKSTLAKDILYAEGQRRYLDCLSPYARQFVTELKKPDIERIERVQPTICVHQHTFQPSRFSTIATMSEVYNFLRLLYAKIGVQYCPDHPEASIAPLSPPEIADLIADSGAGQIRILAPIVKLRKGFHKPVFTRAIAAEIDEVRVDGFFGKPSAYLEGLERNKAHSIDFVVARLNPARVARDLLRQAVEQALALGSGAVIVHTKSGERVFSMDRTCPVCRRGFLKPDPEDLSFSSRRGRCSACDGTGLGKKGGPCKACGGSRIGPIGRNLRLGGATIFELCANPASWVVEFLKRLEVPSAQRALCDPIVTELSSRVVALSELGLDHLELSRSCDTLSSGELQRLRLATAMGSPLTGVMYIFDEPSAGQHPVDNRRVIRKLRDLQARGNSVLVIEHETETVREADHIIEVGPGAGRNGGTIVFNGSSAECLAEGSSLSAEQIARDPVPARHAERAAPIGSLEITASNVHNIAEISCSIPLGNLVTIAGVAGAGKSTLVHEIMCKTMLEGDHHERRGTAVEWVLGGSSVRSSMMVDKIVTVDQQPVGSTSRSTPASYLGVWDEIRKLFAATAEAKTRGWTSSYFSYNTGKGRCPECQGVGFLKFEMNFLPDAAVSCERCGGGRFSEEANTVRYLGHAPASALALTFEEARQVFARHRKVHQPLALACDLGLGYLSLGQSSSSLSGGESQRLKLVDELSRRPQGHAIYLLDEPTTGLHPTDVSKLTHALRELVKRGSSVVVIEHDPAILAASDWILELGPGAGRDGGRIVFAGDYEELREAPTAWGEYLRGTTSESGSLRAERAHVSKPPRRARSRASLTTA